MFQFFSMDKVELISALGKGEGNYLKYYVFIFFGHIIKIIYLDLMANQRVILSMVLIFDYRPKQTQ